MLAPMNSPNRRTDDAGTAVDEAAQLRLQTGTL